MSWNYRIMKYEDGSCGIHEVYYDESDVQGYTEQAVAVYGNDLEELEATYDMMCEAFNKPVLEYK